MVNHLKSLSKKTYQNQGLDLTTSHTGLVQNHTSANNFVATKVRAVVWFLFTLLTPKVTPGVNKIMEKFILARTGLI